MTDRKVRLLKARVALSLRATLKRQPTRQEVEEFTTTALVLWKVVLGTKAAHQQIKDRGQLVIF